MHNVFWCDKCKIPLLTQKCDLCHTEGVRISSDVRPVFPEEKKLIEILFDYPNGYLKDKSVWDTKSNYLIIDGKTVLINKNKFMKYNPEIIRNKLLERIVTDIEQKNFTEKIELYINANATRINKIEFEAFEIIKQARTGRDGYIPIVSFSGGKDSTVVSDLVRRAYANQSILHIFGNTTLELPETQNYVKRFKNQHRKIPFFESQSRHDFFNLCNQIGPPSRIMRWCCTVFKTGPISQTFDSLSKSRPILTYYGIRKSESTRRAKYNAIEPSPKVIRQIVASPIINWSDADIWLYILAKKIDFNDAYRLGYSRVGCWACPSNSLWSFFLNRVYHPKLSEPWREYLISFAISMNKKNPVEYIDSGSWKARQGGNGLKNAYKGIVTSHPCGDDPNAKTYTLNKSISADLYEYFKPFGHVDLGKGRSLLGEVFVVDKKTQEPIIVLQGRTGTNDLRVKIVNSNNPTLLMQRIDCQIRKYQSCVLCGGCPSVCPFGAISDNTGRYMINEEKCKNCLKCVAHFDTGCLVSKVLKTKRGYNI